MKLIYSIRKQLPCILLIYILTFLFCADIKAQTYDPDSIRLLKSSLERTRPDTLRIRLFIRIGNYYLFKPGSEKSDLDNALNYYDQALGLSRAVHSIKWENETLKLKGDCYFEGGDLNNGNKNFMPVIAYYQSIGDKRHEAETWVRLGDCVQNDFNPEFQNEQLTSYQQGAKLYHQTNDKLKEIETLKLIADFYLNYGKLDLAENELLVVLAEYKAIHYPKLQFTYDLLSVVYGLKGDLHKQFYYNLEAIKSMESSGDATGAITFYYRIAETYAAMKMYDQSFIYYEKVLLLVRDGDTYDRALINIVKVLLAQHKFGLALKALKEGMAKFPPVSAKQNYYISAAFAEYYEGLKNYSLAEKYHLEKIKWSDKLLYSEQAFPRENAEDYKSVSDFYLINHNYKKAEVYLKKMFDEPKGIMTPASLSEAHLMQFKIDSALGNYLDAIRHFQMHKSINDSLFNATKSKQIAELNIKFESDKKDRNIELLKKQSQLNLEKEERAKFTRNMVIGGSGMLCLLLGLLYNRYQIKQRSNLQLQQSQKVIITKNTDLEKALRDNEWLLREVHHRVKNNLQIVMSLLSSQSAYLEDEAALSAVKESQHRVQAMSIIHQKLYKSENISKIFMPEYVNDLVDYLKESFKSEHRIAFDLQIEPVNLDVLYAVPIGLILNEVVTNALKYAFPFSSDDRILVRLNKTAFNTIEMLVADNGKGFQSDFKLTKDSSFGLTLVAGLTEELNGEFKIENNNGTALNFIFKIE